MLVYIWLVDCRYAASRLAAQRSIAGWVGEATGGLSYLEFIRGLAKRVEADWEGVQVRQETCCCCCCCCCCLPSLLLLVANGCML
jgi:hypothetical protein